MKVATQDATPIVAQLDKNNVRDVTFGRSRAAVKMMLNVLTSSVYKDKIAAQWREYGCNAADAHIEAGKPEVPIEITLPTVTNCEAVIRDFGPGVNDERMDLYCSLGESTKRDSNEETGTYGMGAKAGFAYGDMFTVTSFIQGVKRIYQFFREDEMPRMAKLSEGTTDAPDGTEIKIPVRREHVAEFAEKAEKVFRYFKIQPIVHGGSLDYKRGHPVFNGEGWRVVGDGKSIAVMGNVGYRLQSDLLDLSYGDAKDDAIESLLELGIELDFKIGDLEIAPDREYLQYSDPVRKMIKKKCQKVILDLADVFKAEIANSKTLWEAKQAYAEAFEKMGSEDKQTLRDIIDGNVTWNGHKIDSGRFYIAKDQKDTDTQITLYEKRSYGRRKIGRNSEPEYVYPRANGLTMVLNDLPKLSMPQSRIAGHFVNNPEAQCLVIFTFQTQKAKDDYMKLRQMDGVPFINFSSIQPFHSLGTSGSGPSAHRSKHSAKAFVLDEKAERSRSEARSLCWQVERVDADKGKGVYVIINKFKVMNASGDDYEPEDVSRDMKILRNRGYLKGKVYGFKAGSKIIEKLGPGWVTLQKHFDDLGEALTKQHGQVLADYQATQGTASLLPLRVASKLSAGPARESIETWQLMNKPQGISESDAKFLLGDDGEPWLSLGDLPDPTFDLHEIYRNVTETYPMLEGWRYCSSNNEKTLTILADYIRLVDTTKTQESK